MEMNCEQKIAVICSALSVWGLTCGRVLRSTWYLISDAPKKVARAKYMSKTCVALLHSVCWSPRLQTALLSCEHGIIPPELRYFVSSSGRIQLRQEL